MRRKSINNSWNTASAYYSNSCAMIAHDFCRFTNSQQVLSASADNPHDGLLSDFSTFGRAGGQSAAIGNPLAAAGKMDHGVKEFREKSCHLGDNSNQLRGAYCQ
jgi:hypothetical protein